MDISTRPGLDMSMASKLKKCRYCKGMHRKRSAYLKCKRRNGKVEYWS